MNATRRGFLVGALGLAVTPAARALAHGRAMGQATGSPRPIPTPEQFQASLRARRNWGRWGADDQIGAVNLITPAKRRAAARLVTSGRAVSLSRPFNPAQQFVRSDPTDGAAGGAIDYYGFIYHGFSATHIDALCHVWGADGVWNGRKPTETITSTGSTFGDIANWKDGIVTRGVLLDVPRHRGTPHVTVESPVHGAELDAIGRAQGVTLEPGDALLVYSGREAWERGGGNLAVEPRPGLHPSCAEFVRDHDVALLGWDIMDATVPAYGSFPMHGVLYSYGVALLDNASFEALANACREEGRDTFMFAALPLRVERGTGSPANPVALF